MSSQDQEEEEIPLAVPIEDSQSFLTPPTEIKDVATDRSQPVPVLLITGFLGAGKTTLLNYILTEKHGYRCAVILNEFGESAGIEKALLNDTQDSETISMQDWVQLSNGCACCTVKNDFVKALEDLMSQNGSYDYILIETTGLASPGPMAATLWTDEELEAQICLDAIVTVVDACHIRKQLDESREGDAINEAQEQVAYADVILLNKVDLVSEAQTEEISGRLNGINEVAHIHMTKHCRIDLGLILDRYSMNNPETASKALKSRKLEANSEKNLNREETEQNGHSHRHGADDANHLHADENDSHHHKHDQQIRTVRLELQGLLNLERLKQWLDELLWERDTRQEDVLRLKGLVNVEGHNGRKVVQAVQEVYDIHDIASKDDHDSPLNEIVLIGRHLDQDVLLSSLRTCLVK